MRRREFITLVGGAVTWPVAVRAQPQEVWRVGVLMAFAESDPEPPNTHGRVPTGASQAGLVGSEATN
jgi:hypothetical protein